MAGQYGDFICDASKLIQISIFRSGGMFAIPQNVGDQFFRVKVDHICRLAWVVREAVDKYLTTESPLFRESR